MSDRNDLPDSGGEQPRTGPDRPWSDRNPGQSWPAESVAAPESESDQPTEPVPPSDLPTQPTWLHPGSLIFDLISHFRQLLIPAVIALFSAAQGSWIGILVAALLFVPALFFSAIRYFTFRYMVVDGEMVIREGLLFRRLRTIPVAKIQNIDLIQNPLHRIMGVAEVRVETASGKESEATLRVLAMRQVMALRQEIFGQREPGPVRPVSDPAGGDLQEPRSVPAATTETLLEVPVIWLIKAGLASNRGILLIGVVAGVIYQYDLESSEWFKRIIDRLPALDGSVFNSLLLAGGVLVVLVIFRLLGIVWYVLRFSGYRLTRHGEDLRVSCGLLTRVSATIPRKRIQFISIHRTLIMGWMGLAAIRIETAGGGGGQAEDASAMVSRRWFVPVIPGDRVAGLLAELRPGLQWDETTPGWQPLADNARPRMIRMALIQSVIVGLIGLPVSLQWGWLAGVMIAPVLMWWANRKSRAMRYCRRQDQVIYRSGVLNRKTSLTFLDKVQTARFDQSPFDRRWRQARLTVDTAAAGPAEHRITVPYLAAAFANQEYRVISENSARYQPDFG